MVTDRLNGVSGGLGRKAPCRVATTANITLSGTQTIDGVSVVADDRVLVKNQSTASENGIYKCASGAWSRAVDFDGTNDVIGGTVVHVLSGTINSRGEYALTTTGAITVGTTSLSFERMNPFFVSGAPSHSASKGALAIRSDGSSSSTRLYINSDGSTGWVAITTAS